jgi:hypothetical protein
VAVPPAQTGRGVWGWISGDHPGLRGRYKEGIAEGHPIHSEDDGLEAGGPESRGCGGSLCEERVSVGVAHAEGPLVGGEGIGVGDGEGDFGVAAGEAADGDGGFGRDEGVGERGLGCRRGFGRRAGRCRRRRRRRGRPGLHRRRGRHCRRGLLGSQQHSYYLGREDGGAAETLARRAHATAATAAFSASPP